MINERIARTRRASPSNTKQVALLNATEINREMLSIAESQNAIPRSKEVGGKLDRSKVTMVTADDVKDLENLEHVLSVVGYEPRKIGNVAKRKTVDTFNGVQDSGKYI